MKRNLGISVPAQIINANIKPLNLELGNIVVTDGHQHPNLPYLNTLTDPTIDQNIQEEVFNDQTRTW